MLLFSQAVLYLFTAPELNLATRISRLRRTIWGRQVIIDAHAVLTEFVQVGEQPYALSFSDAPDHLFHLVSISALVLIKTRNMHGVTQPHPLPTLGPLLERVTEFLKRLALTEDHVPMRCAMLIETLMRAQERIRAKKPRDGRTGGSGDSGTPPAIDNRQSGQLGPSSRPLASTSDTASSAPTPAGPGSDSVPTDKDYMRPMCDMEPGGLLNLDQMGGIEMFFSQPMWPEDVLSGVFDQSDEEVFDLKNLFGFHDTQPPYQWKY